MAGEMLHNALKNDEARDHALIANQPYITRALNLHEEWYLAMTIDRERYCPAIIISKRDGVGNETVTKVHPEKPFTFHFKISDGMTPELVAQISQRLNISPDSKQSQSLETILNGLYRIFTEKDATLIEIDPLVRAGDILTCRDAKFTFDDAAEKRQTDLFALRNSEQEIPEEVEAEKHGLVYVRMEGNVGNVVNGAGLAMATNDAIGLYGGASANFLDAGGQATQETMLKAFGIVARDERVRTILVNIYGGITDCSMIARSIIGAKSELGAMRMPVVVRLQGTNSAEGLKLVSRTSQRQDMKSLTW